MRSGLVLILIQIQIQILISMMPSGHLNLVVLFLWGTSCAVLTAHVAKTTDSMYVSLPQLTQLCWGHLRWPHVAGGCKTPPPDDACTRLHPRPSTTPACTGTATTTRRYRQYEAEGHDLQSLLYNFLDEILFAFSTEFLVCRDVQVTCLDRQAFKITATG